ncbi:MAG: hypothetical protein U0269_12965 [Polyangiales bacterium]
MARSRFALFESRANRAVIAALLSASLARCAASVSPDAGDGAASMDARVTMDSGVREDARPVPDVARRDALAPFECNVAEDCTGLATPEARFARGWSCLGGRCVYSVSPGESCGVPGDGCVYCAGQAPVCEGAPGCPAGFDPSRAQFEFGNCARNYLPSIRACFGRFVRLDDGEHCVISEAPTGAIRYVLNCGFCESTYVPTR